jgi:hypothetical protein
MIQKDTLRSNKMDEIKYIIIGSGISLFSALIIQMVSHILTKIRESEKLTFERERLLAKLQNKVDDKKRKVEQLNSRERELLHGTIVLKNQLRDALLGYDEKKMKFRANKIKIITDEMDIQELRDIAEGKKPLPDIPD